MKKSSSTDYRPSNRACPTGFLVFDLSRVQVAEATPFPIYKLIEKKPVRWREAGLPFTQTEIHRIAGFGPEEVFCLENTALEAWARFLEGRYFKCEAQGLLSDEKHLELLEDAVTKSLQALYQRPNSEEIRTSIDRQAMAIVRFADSETWLSSARQDLGYLFRVTVLSCSIARFLAMSAKQVHQLALGSLLQDIGLCLEQDEPGRVGVAHPLFATHPQLGATLLTGNGPVPAATHEVVIGHHERIDGSGFPFGLSGTQIPTSAQIVGLADAIDMAYAKHADLDESEFMKGFVKENRFLFDPQLLIIVETLFKQASETNAE